MNKKTLLSILAHNSYRKYPILEILNAPSASRNEAVGLSEDSLAFIFLYRSSPSLIHKLV